ncbi:TerB family tellurite resistance protein [Litchfieldella xinjiangensis]|uniref:tellurite resistance TerB family protein n=1 Tax=Litchfieldella xinjiangensis TaxID=1166948 RepID=UPI0005BE405E|nr:TerB family tellurite resistance protein [Halomonas xinjiangensis]
MLDAVQQFFQRALANPANAEDRNLTLELATAALLCEIVRADYHTSDAELGTLRALLMRRFGLSDEAVGELMALAEQEAEDAVDHYQFVSLVKEHYGYEERVELVRMMWQLAFSDNELDTFEEHRIRRLAGLLHVSHGDFIKTKLDVQSHATGSASE